MTVAPCVRLDVRPVLAVGGEAFEMIMFTAGRIPIGGMLELTAPLVAPADGLNLQALLEELQSSAARAPSMARGTASRPPNSAIDSMTPGRSVASIAVRSRKP